MIYRVVRADGTVENIEAAKPAVVGADGELTIGDQSFEAGDWASYAEGEGKPVGTNLDGTIKQPQPIGPSAVPDLPQKPEGAPQGTPPVPQAAAPGATGEERAAAARAASKAQPAERATPSENANNPA